MCVDCGIGYLMMSRVLASCEKGNSKEIKLITATLAWKTNESKEVIPATNNIYRSTLTTPNQDRGELKKSRLEKIEEIEGKKKSKTSIPDHRGEKKRKRSQVIMSEKVRASHLLIKHQGSRRKTSWRDPEGKVISTITKESAIQQLKALREDIISGKVKFSDLASTYSDCNSAKRGGDLGSFGRGKMQKPFEEATFALKVGEISDIVETDSGVHIIPQNWLS